MSRANIANGKLKSPPPSYKWAIDRLVQIKHEMQEIKAQLDDVGRATKLLAKSAAEYDKWRDAATSALQMYQLEDVLTERWIVDWLLHSTYQVLTKLELEWEFEPEEEALMEKLDEHFKERT